jgi:CTP:molybdopterin cytidylyltransferase MocA
VKESLAAIVLAAGASRRLGRPKQLVLHKGETLLARAIRLADEAGSDPVFYVLGANRERILESVLASRGIEVNNERWDEGISTSIHAGLEALEQADPEAKGVLILPCDQPLLTADHLQGLIEEFLCQDQPCIVASAYAGALGIPAAFPRFAFADLRALQGDKGARSLLMSPACPLIAVPFEGGEIDIDEPGDVAGLE